MIKLDEWNNPGNFVRGGYIVTYTPDGFMHMTLTGVVVVEIKGSGGNWRHDEVQFGLKFHGFRRQMGRNVAVGTVCHSQLYL